jgi:hypothetical protein
MEQIFYFISCELILRLHFIHDSIGHSLFCYLPIIDSFLHSKIRDESIDVAVSSLPVAVHATDSLRVETWIPRHIHDNHPIRGDQIDSETTRSRREGETIVSDKVLSRNLTE